MGPTVDNQTITDVGLCSTAVLELMEGLEFHGHHMYIDNFYINPMLYLTMYNE